MELQSTQKYLYCSKGAFLTPWSPLLPSPVLQIRKYLLQVAQKRKHKIVLTVGWVLGKHKLFPRSLTCTPLPVCEGPLNSLRKAFKTGGRGSLPGNKSFKVFAETFLKSSWLPPPTYHKPGTRSAQGCQTVPGHARGTGSWGGSWERPRRLWCEQMGHPRVDLQRQHIHWTGSVTKVNQ